MKPSREHDAHGRGAQCNGVDLAHAASGDNAMAIPAPTRVRLLYESRDGKLCLFEDSSGHITAVRASRLA